MPRCGSRSPLVVLGALVLAALALVAFGPGLRSASALETGYNQAWIGQAYGHDLTASFDRAAIDQVMRRARESGGRVVRLWLLEGRDKEGIVWDRGVPAGVDPRLLTGIGEVMQSARREGVLVYWTLFDGNWFWPREGAAYHGHWNLLNNRYGVRDAFEVAVLAPLLDQLARDADLIFGLDLINEVQGLVRTWDFTDGWDGARVFIREMASAVHAQAPWLRVTASAGHHTAVDDLLAGRLSGIGLDFFDVHVYDDQGRIPEGPRLAAFARSARRPIVLGEFGQKTERRDDALQVRATRAFLLQAHALGFQAALGWRLDDERRDPAWTAHHSYFWLGRPRPAVAWVRWLAPHLRARAGAPLPWWLAW